MCIFATEEERMREMIKYTFFYVYLYLMNLTYLMGEEEKVQPQTETNVRERS